MSGLHLESATLVGVNESPHFECGWHERERDGRCGVVYRAGGPEAVLRLRREPSARCLCLLLSGPRGLAEETLEGSISVNESEHRLELATDVWVSREFALPTDDREELRIVLSLPNAPCPNDVIQNGDPRRLGWFISAVWQE